MANATEICSSDDLTKYVAGVNAQLWRSDTLMVANAVLVMIMVAISASGRRYRQTAASRILFQGATTLYLSIVSYVASSIGKYNEAGLHVKCYGAFHVFLLLIWTVLVQIIGTNTCAMIAVEDGDSLKVGPSIELLSRTIWTSYLVFYFYSHPPVFAFFQTNLAIRQKLFSKFLLVLCVLSLVKISLKFYAFERARRSFAIGRNSPLVAGYMEQLLGESHRASQDEELLPPLLVMGEEKQETEETPYGYTIKKKNNSLVTIDRVWRMGTGNDNLFAPRPWLKDLCLSFALFKCLRRRFEKDYRVIHGCSIKSFNLVLNVLLKQGINSDTVFKVLSDEVSFVLDSYYSSIRNSNFGRLLPILNIIVSFCILIVCLLAASMIAPTYLVYHHQILCSTACRLPSDFQKNRSPIRRDQNLVFGNLLFSSIPTLSLIVAVVIAEAWEIVSYLCSDWLKVTLICSYVTHASWQQSPRMQRFLDLVLKLRIKFMKHWTDQMGQISLLAHPEPKKCALGGLLFCFSNRRVQQVKVSAEIKTSIIGTLRSSKGCLSKGTAALRRSGIGHGVLWACEGEDTSHDILVWHIATGIYEARHGASAGFSADKKTATHLSRYCVYLMANIPELLPSGKAWSKKLYETVSEDIRSALAGGGQSSDMVALLVQASKHEVVKKGVKLGTHLVELAPNEETGWRTLAGFWSEMILDIAPSDNIKAHKKAHASGIELLTLIWVLLTHAGIVTRPNIQAAV